MANNGAFIDKGALWAQLEWMRDAGTQYDRFCTSAEIDAYNAALRDVTQRIKRMPTRCVTNSWTASSGVRPSESAKTFAIQYSN